MRYLTIIFCVFLVAFSFHRAQARIIHVPGDSPTIQAGINGAIDGDTVLVVDGTYTGDGNRDIDFQAKAIVVMSENGPEVTIIDCEGSHENQHRGFYFHSREDSNAVVQGFTITNGYLYRNNGAGICCDSSSPTIVSNIINGNKAIGSGGGVFCSQSSPTITHCSIVHDKAEGGGGICCFQSSPTIDSCTIIGNMARWVYLDGSSYGITDSMANRQQDGTGCGGGSLCVDSSNPTITNCSIGGNFAFFAYLGGSGGGISCVVGSSPRISNCTIENNWIGYGLNHGGGISCWTCSSPIITNCTIRYNFAPYGAGVACDSSSPEINYCTIIGNMAAEGGGGIGCWRSGFLNILNCTITRNTATHGGGISCHDCDFFSEITNTILWDDSPDEIYAYSGAPPVFFVTYSDIEGGWPGVGNRDCDPLFCDPQADNYSLAENSCCAGEGEGGVDIGAFGVECDPIYTCGDANGDATVNSADVVYLINYLFKNGPAPDPLWVGDCNLDVVINSADVVYLINYLFKGGPPPCEP